MRVNLIVNILVLVCSGFQNNRPPEFTVREPIPNQGQDFRVPETAWVAAWR